MHPAPDYKSNGRRTGTTGFDDLVRKAQDGDRAAMDRVLDLLRPYLARLAQPFVDPGHPVQSTADLLQESCLRAWQKLESFQGGGNDEETFAMFRSWLGQIVRRLGVDSQRARNRQRRSPPNKVLSLRVSGPGDSTVSGRGRDGMPAAQEPTPSAYVRADERAQAVAAALDKMPDPTDAAIVRLHVFEGMMFSDIARRLGLGYDRVRARFAAVMRRLERELDGWA